MTSSLQKSIMWLLMVSGIIIIAASSKLGDFSLASASQIDFASIRSYESKTSKQSNVFGTVIGRQDQAIDPETCLREFQSLDESGYRSWDAMVATGDWLSNLMRSGTIEVEGQRECCPERCGWNEFSSLEKNGWTADSDFGRGISDLRHDSLRQLYNFLGVSTSESDNRAWYFRNDKKVTIDGKEYDATGTIYNNIYNPRAIFAESNFDTVTHHKAKLLPEQYSQGEIAHYRTAPLKKWSDVTFTAFQENCRQRSAGDDGGFDECMKGLRVIVWSNITNSDTKKVVKHVLRCTQNGESNLEEFRAAAKLSLQNSDAAKALLQTPNGAAIAWFLGQHKDQLGWKLVDKILIFSCNGGSDELCLAFTVVNQKKLNPPVLESWKKEQNLPEAQVDTRGTGGTDSTIQGTGSGSKECETYEEPRRKSWDDYVATGNRWRDVLHSGATADQETDEQTYCVEQSQWTNWDALEANGWRVEWNADYDKDEVLSLSMAQMYHALDLSQRNEDNHEWELIQKSQVEIDGTVYKPTMGHYSNLCNPKMIMAQSSYSPLYKELHRIENYEEEYPGHKAEHRAIVPLQRWSDVAFLTWEQDCRRRNIPEGRGADPDLEAVTECLRALEIILRSTITNVDTRELARIALERKLGTSDLRLYNSAAHFSLDSDEGKALLGSPNGAGVFWFLAQHRKQLGWKVVGEVVVFACDNDRVWKLCLAFLLKDHPTGNTRS